MFGDGRSEVVSAATGHPEYGALKEDQLSHENPCRIPGYDKETSTERPVGPPPQVFALSQLVERRYARWCCLQHSRACGGVSSSPCELRP